MTHDPGIRFDIGSLCPLDEQLFVTVHSRRRNAARVAIVTAVVGLHMIFLVWLMRARQPAHPIVEPRAMVVGSIPAPAVPLPQADAPLDVGLVAPAVEVATSADPPAAACDVPAAVGTALRADPAVTAALATTAAEPARAIMVWNGDWAKAPEAQALRRAVGAALEAARADCLDETLTGPRLVFVLVDGNTVTIAFGSGVWSWRRLLLSKDGGQ